MAGLWCDDYNEVMRSVVPPPSTKNSYSSSLAGDVSDGEEQAARAEAREARNFLVIALYQIVMRIGWIFKTESIVMPAVLDSLGGAGWLRGCLPLLNRLGNSLAPLLFARRMKIMRRKKWALAACMALMSAVFLALSGLWFATGGVATAWMRASFLLLYTAFFICIGIHQLALGTLQGKLIHAVHRGRLMLFSNVIGSIAAIVCAWYLLRQWLTPDTADFRLIFLFSGAAFAVCVGVSLLLSEPADHYRQARSPLRHLFSDVRRTMREDANFRRLMGVAALFGSSIMLFPHYQALGRDVLGISLDAIILWVVVQNAGTGAFSLVAGPLADRCGNRLVLRVSVLAICVCPLAALWCGALGETGKAWYWAVFVLVGLTPITIRTLMNYTLEVAEPAEHPRYLSALSLSLAAPIFFSPLMGLLVDVAGFAPVFLGVTVLVFGGWLLTFSLAEPRHHLPESPDAAVSDEAAC
ncbi:MAG: MFS transporter [Pirellulaceae bacterium]